MFQEIRTDEIRIKRSIEIASFWLVAEDVADSVELECCAAGSRSFTDDRWRDRSWSDRSWSDRSRGNGLAVRSVEWDAFSTRRESAMQACTDVRPDRFEVCLIEGSSVLNNTTATIRAC